MIKFPLSSENWGFKVFSWVILMLLIFFYLIKLFKVDDKDEDDDDEETEGMRISVIFEFEIH